MEYDSFAQLQARLQEHLQQKEYDEALELATAALPQFPEQAHLLYYWRAAFAARLGNPSLSLRILQDVLDTGFWYGPPLLTHSPSFASLQDNPAFQRLLDQNAALQAADEKDLYPLLILRSEDKCARSSDAHPAPPPCPWMIALHANAALAQSSIDFWRPAAASGLLVAAPQSTQPLWKNAYMWDDLDQTREQVIRLAASVRKQYAVDDRRLFLAGHSLGAAGVSGAEAALWLALTAPPDLPARGFLLAGLDGPFTRDLTQWEAVLADVVRRSVVSGPPNLTGYVLIGAEDLTVEPDNVAQLVDMLNETGIPTDLEIVPLAGRDYSPEWDAPLQRALAFLTQSI